MKTNQHKWKKTLRQEKGASLPAAVLFFALCGFGASFLLALASSGSQNFSSATLEEQKRLAVESAAAFLRDTLSAPENVVKIKEEATEDAEGKLLRHQIRYYYVGFGENDEEESWTPFTVRESILDSLIRDSYIPKENRANLHRRLAPKPKHFSLYVKAGEMNDQKELPQLKTEVSLSMNTDYGITAIVSEKQTASDREADRWERRLIVPAQVDTVTETFSKEDFLEEQPDEEEQIQITVWLTTIRWENGRIEKELLKP